MSTQTKRSPRPPTARGVFLCSAILGGLLLAGMLFAGPAHASSPTRSKSLFTHPDTYLAGSQKMDFILGKSLFAKLWVSSPSSTTASDGLGPLYNARSCLQCHPRNGRGRPYAANNPADRAAPMLIRLGGEQFDPVYGEQLQTRSIQGIAAEAEVLLTYQPEIVTLAGEEQVTLRRPHWQLTNLNYGPLAKESQLSARIPPALIGLGLLEAIPEQQLQALADPHDQDGDGISGRLNQVHNHATGKVSIGRFGWKAGQPSLVQQNAAALHNDIGISTTMFPAGYGDCSPAQTDCRQRPDGNSAHMDNVEASDQMLALITLYTRHLAVPATRTHRSTTAGAQLFNQIGCAACHQPSYTIEHQGETVTFAPYTDLLLHDMGADLADNRPEFRATGQEWRTAPLWAIGLVQTINPDARFLHDGRARTLQEAILWHGGEALSSRQAYVELMPDQRQQLLTFLESL